MIMRRKSIDHILRAAAEVTNNKRFVLIGSAALMARIQHVPLNMMYTPEIDIYAPDADDIELASELIDGSIGQGSQRCRVTGAIVRLNTKARNVQALLP
jgi:cobalamin-dependent methionine synthase I